MDALHGDLRTFPLDRVLAMVAAATQSGVLRVETGGHTGRIYLVDGFLTYATTREGEGSVERLRSLRPAHERRGRRHADDLRALILQQIAEVILRLERTPAGRFWFVDGVTTKAYGDREPERFTVPEVLHFVDERRSGWSRIRQIVPGGRRRFVMAPSVDRSVTLTPDEFELLAATGEGTTVSELAERLGTFEFTAAGWVADLVEQGLLVPVEEASRIRAGERAVVIDLEVSGGAR